MDKDNDGLDGRSVKQNEEVMGIVKDMNKLIKTIRKVKTKVLQN